MRDRISRVLADMGRGTYERNEALALSLLSALAGESIFLLGLPGVGKSMIARRLKTAFRGGKAFEYLMSRFSTPDEIFGPVSIAKLKDEDSYERVITGYLPEAEVVFLDEIWKAGPAIQNSLLTVLNERVYLNGNREIKLPLKGVIAASNELPAKDEGLEALWDRFLIRYVVNPIEKRDNFMLLIDGNESVKKDEIKRGEVESKQGVDTLPAFTDEEYAYIGNGSRKICLPPLVKDIIFKIRERMNAKMREPDRVTGTVSENNRQYYISDRRWRKAVGVLRTSALLNDREEVDCSDLLLLCHMLWNEEEGIANVRQIVVETMVSSLFKAVLDEHKSPRRHAVLKKEDTLRLYSPDTKNYIIEAEGSPMKIAITDYEKIMKEPTGVFFGAETADGRIILRKQGQFVIRWVKRGHLSINNFIYSLRTVSDEQFTPGLLQELGGSVSEIANNLYKSINQNLFLQSEHILQTVNMVTGIYKERFRD